MGKMDKPDNKRRKVSFAMRHYEPEEAFRRAVGRYRSDMGDRTDSEPALTVKLISVEWCHHSWEAGPYFDWEFEVLESQGSPQKEKAPIRCDLCTAPVTLERPVGMCIRVGEIHCEKCCNQDGHGAPGVDLRWKIFRGLKKL